MNELEENFNIDLEDFDIEIDNIFEDKEEIITDSNFVKPKKVLELKSSQIKWQNATDLVKRINLQSNEDVFCLVKGNFIFGDFLANFLIHHDICAEELTVSTLSLDYYNIGCFKELFEKGYVKKLNLIISDYFYSHERKKIVQYIYDELSSFDFQLCVLRSHVKSTTILTDRGKKITIHGSANLRSSDNIEQFHLTFDEEIFDFMNEYQNKVIDKFFTIKKPLTNKNIEEIWQKNQEVE